MSRKLFLLHIVMFTVAAVPTIADWPMAGANPQRTSWVADEVAGDLTVAWYKPIEPFISQNTQIIAADGKLFLSTAKGLYALNAVTGDLLWTYPTELPLGHSPTYDNGSLYVGGYDGKIHKINASTGAGIWQSSLSKRGFATNPLVMNNRVYAGSRDGSFCALDTSNGALVWSYDTDGPVLFSPAYYNGVVFFASNDSYAYALDAADGSLVWKSAKLPGQGFSSWWPVIYRNYVVLAGSNNYRNVAPGRADGMQFTGAENAAIWPNYETLPRGTLYGPTGTEPGDWAVGYQTVDATTVMQYYEAKPYRHTVFVLDISTGTEVTWDLDSDSNPEYAPYPWTGTHSGNRFPPVIGSDDVIYMNAMWGSDPYIAVAALVGWKIGTQYVIGAGSNGACDEPRAFAAGGNYIYFALTCHRAAGSINISIPNTQGGRAFSYWSYNLDQIIPGYDDAWTTDSKDTHIRFSPDSINGIYGGHGCQNPPIPYNGKVYLHRGNSVLALASQGSHTALTAAPTVDTTDTVTVDIQEIQQRLIDEVQAVINAGHLLPGWHSTGLTDYRLKPFDGLTDYFHHPADVHYYLTRAYPHLPSGLQDQVKTYLQSEFSNYPPYQYNHIGFNQGTQRTPFTIPDDVLPTLANYPPQTAVYLSDIPWQWAPQQFYGMYKYAQLFPAQAASIYNAAKNKMPSVPADSLLIDRPYFLNAWIVGHIGYLELEALAGAPETTSMRTELNRLLALRSDNFSKDTPWPPGSLSSSDAKYQWALNISRNFIYLVPELAQHLHDNVYNEVREAVDEYARVAPFWFVSAIDNTYGEASLEVLHNCHAVMQARAQILKESQQTLAKYLDVPGFPVGDLFYIDNLVAILEATEAVAAPEITPAGGTFMTSVEVFISTATSGADIYYTADGSIPDQNSILYTGPFILSADTTIRAAAFKTGMADSAITTADFTFDFGPWAMHTIDNSSLGADGTRLGDFDSDGLPDIVTGWEEGDIVRVYKNPGPTQAANPWPAVTAGPADAAEDAFFMDFDYDGSPDVVSSTEGTSRTIFVHWAPADINDYMNPALWATQAIPVTQNLQQWMFCIPLEVDQQNTTDIIAAGKKSGSSVGWLQAPSDPTNLAAWQWHKISDTGWTMSVYARDMDGDSDQDVIIADRMDDVGLRGIRWLENPGPGAQQTSLWTNHFIGAQDKEVMFFDMADLDQDGLEDIICAVKPGPILFFRRLTQFPATYAEYQIPMPSGVGTGKATGVKDVDGNGDNDIVVSCELADGALSGVFWLSQPDPNNFTTWDYHEISGVPGTKYDLVVLYDLDADNDLDVITCEETESLGVIWYENPMSPPGGAQNQAPYVDAGSDQVITLPDDDAALDATVTDDGLPDPPAAVGVTWTKQSDPGTVTFADENAVDTTATFSAEGDYILRITADDGALSTYDELTVTVNPVPDLTPPTPDPLTWSTTPHATGPTSIFMTATTASDPSGVEYYFECTAGAGHDSGWQDSTTYEDLTLAPGTQYTYRVKARDKSTNLNETAYSTSLAATTQDASGTPVSFGPTDDAYIQSGTAYNNASLRAGGIRTSYLKFDLTSLGSAVVLDAKLKLKDKDTSDRTGVSLTCHSGSHNNWTETNLSTANAPDPNQLLDTVTGTVTAGQIVQWNVTLGAASGGICSFVVGPGGTDLVLDSKEGAIAPELVVTVISNSAPNVYAGDDQVITLPDNDAALDATVTDDGLPNPPAAFTVTWSKQSGSGTVNFANENAVDTSATFSAEGDYVLRLTADDSQFSSYDEVTITVAPPADSTPPTPDPLTWATVPYATGPTSISMTATTASDPSGVEYYFECTAGAGHNSNWQTQTTYQDSSLTPNTQYSYRVKTRDISINFNETDWSVTLPATTEPYDPNLDPNLTALYMLDETSGLTAHDSSQFSYDGTLNGPTWAPTEGMIDGAVQFDANTAARIEIPTSSLSAASGTIALWGRLVGTQTGTRYLFGHTSNPTGWSDRIQIYMDNSDNQLDLGFGGSHALRTNVFTFSSDTWYHVALTWNAGDFNLYVNGLPQTSGTYTNLTTLGSTANIGNDGAAAPFEAFQGLIDDVRIYDCALAQTDVNDIYQQGIDANQPQDTDPPTPDPSTWATTPYSTGTTSISMTANTASDPSGVEYYFECTAGGGNDSGWQDSTTYEDTGLSPDTQYTYRVQARDKSANQNATAWSSSLAATTDPLPTNQAPTVDAGNDDQITLPVDTVSLDATVTDDGLPNPPAAFTVTWTKQSGPGTVDFGNENAVDTSATFSTDGVYVLRLTDDDSDLTDYDEVTITVNPESTGGLPAPWLHDDIGAVSAAGDANYASGTYTVEGSGDDIWQTADEMHFVYQSLSGDGEIVARVATQQNTNGWAKAGVMIRETLATGSVHAFSFLTPGNGTGSSRRYTTDATTSGGASGTAVAPYWVKLVRAANLFTAYHSPDGTNWTQHSSVTVSMSANAYVSLAVTSHYDGVLSTVDFDNVTVSGGAAPDTTPPTPDPLTWATVPYSTGTTSISMTATTASDPSGVEYYFDCTAGAGHDSGWQDGTTYEDTGLTPSTQYTYRVQARDKSANQNTGGWSTTQSATTDTPADTTPPTPNPLTWATVPYSTGTTSISMTATTASDPSGVEYYFDCTAGSGHDSGWQDSTTYQDTGLSPNTQYTYRVQARDKSANQNAGGWSTSQSATTDSAGGAPTDYVAYYKLDETSGTTAADESANNYDGTLLNGVLWNTNGKYNGCAEFDNVNDYIKVTNFAATFSNVTACCWYKINDVTSNHDVLIRLPGGVAELRKAWMEQVQFKVNIGGILYTANDSNSGITAGTWIHLAGTYDGTTIRVYINGVQKATLSQSGSMNSSTGDFRIGWQDSTSPDGLVDEIYIYPRALSLQEINDVMDAGQ